MEAFFDRLASVVRDKGCGCVGLDPVLDRLPEALTGSPTERIAAFCEGVIEAVAPHVGVIKPQLACFERYGSEGVRVYEQAAAAARDAGLLVVADAKRGDIGISARHYAAAFFEAEHAAHALTVNPYLGTDALQPMIESAHEQGTGLFALLRTSNPGGDAVQALMLADGRRVVEAVGDMLAELGKPYVGSSGYSVVGAVVGATRPEEAASLRERYPEQWFLVPGFGAQGGGLDGVRACQKPDGTGALVTASRSVIYAYEGKPGDWQEAVAQGARELSDAIA